MITIIKDYRNLSLQEKAKFRKIVSKRKSKYLVNYIQSRSLKIGRWQFLASQARHNHLFEKRLLQGL